MESPQWNSYCGIHRTDEIALLLSAWQANAEVFMRRSSFGLRDHVFPAKVYWIQKNKQTTFSLCDELCAKTWIRSSDYCLAHCWLHHWVDCLDIILNIIMLEIMLKIRRLESGTYIVTYTLKLSHWRLHRTFNLEATFTQWISLTTQNRWQSVDRFGDGSFESDLEHSTRRFMRLIRLSIN